MSKARGYLAKAKQCDARAKKGRDLEGTPPSHGSNASWLKPKLRPGARRQQHSQGPL